MKVYKNLQLIKFIILSVIAHCFVLFIASFCMTDYEVNQIKPPKTAPSIIKAQLINYQNTVKKITKPQMTVVETPQPKKNINKKTGVKESAFKQSQQQKKERDSVSNLEQTNDSNNQYLLQKARPGSQMHSSIALPATKSKIDIMAASRKYLSTIPEPPAFNPQNSAGSHSIMAIKNKAKPVPKYHKTIDNSPEGELPKSTTVMCDNPLSKLTATMSVLMGGRVRCQNLPEVKTFLKNRQKQKIAKEVD